MSTSDGCLLTWMEMNRTEVTFADAIVNISTSIGQIFPLANVKGRKAIVSQAETNDVTLYVTHCNGVLFNDKNWFKGMSNDDYKRIPTQMRKLIGIAKANGFTNKQTAFHEEQQQSKRNKKKGVSQVLQNQEDNIVECAISKIAQYYTDKNASSGDSGIVVPNANSSSKSNAKSNANAGSTFGNQNSTGGNR